MTADAIARTIIGFHQDDQGDWVVELACGHNQHVRHDPPWINRPWVTTPDGRKTRLGRSLACRLCATDAAAVTLDLQGKPS